MGRKRFFFYWMVITGLALLVLLAVFTASSTSAQALNVSQGAALQGTPPVSTLLAPTVPVPTAVIPETGGDAVFGDFFTNRMLWAVLVLLVIALLVALVMRSRGPVDPGSHHRHDI